MFGYGWGPILLILLIALLLFGPRRLPELGDSIGKAIKSFKKAHDEPEAEVKGTIPPSTASAPQMNVCSQCQKQYTGDVTFCPHCGNRVAKA